MISNGSWVEEMKKTFVILMLLITSFAFSLDKTAARRALEEEQAVAAKYQEQVTANRKTIEDMSNDAKKRDYQKRLFKLRNRKYVLEYNLKKPRIAKGQQEKLLAELNAVAEEYDNLLQEFETFVNSLN
jgi:ABC-type transporter MlaC component